MMSESLANETLKITTDGLKIASTMTKDAFKVFSSILATMTAITKNIVDKKSDQYKNMRSGEITLKKFLKDGDPLTTLEGISKKDLSLFKDISKKYGVDFVALTDENNNENVKVIIKEQKLWRAKEALAEMYNTIQNQSIQVEDAKDNKIIESEKFYPVKYSNVNIKYENKIDESDIWDKRWEESPLYDKDINNKGGSKKQNFIRNLEDSIEKTLGRTTENYVLLDGGLVYLDLGNTLHVVNLQDGTEELEFFDTSKSIEDYNKLKEVKEAIRKENEKLQYAEKQIQTKYQDYSPEQKAIIYRAIKNGYDASKIDNIKFSHEKMTALLIAMEYQKAGLGSVDINKLLIKDYSANQIYALRIGMEKNFNVEHYADDKLSILQMAKIYEELKQSKTLEREIDLEYINKVKENEMYSRSEDMGITMKDHDFSNSMMTPNKEVVHREHNLLENSNAKKLSINNGISEIARDSGDR